MMADPEMPPTPPVDVRFTADISQKMTVPHHIRFATGDEPNHQRHPDEPVMRRMAVPERILVSGGEQHLSERAPPREIQFDHQVMGMAGDQLPVLLDTPPRTLRLEHLHFPTVGDEFGRKAARAKKLSDELYGDNAGEEDVLQVDLNTTSISTSSQLMTTTDQITRLKHHVTRLTHRVAILEQENEFRGQRDKLMMLVIVAYVGAKFLLWLKRPTFDFPHR